MARPQSDLTKFLLSLPTSLSTAEAVAKAKEKGMETSESNVNRVRQMGRRAPGAKPAGRAKAAKGGKAAKPASAPAKKAAAVAALSGSKDSAPTSDAGKQSKSDFVRSFPATTRANDIVAAAKTKGMKLSVGYVYNIRTAENARAGKPKRSRSPRGGQSVVKKAAPSLGGQARAAQVREARRAAPPAAPRATEGDAEGAFRSAAVALILERGIATAREVLDQISAKLRSAAT
jgi:hypothetical protein